MVAVMKRFTIFNEKTNDQGRGGEAGGEGWGRIGLGVG